MILGTSVTDLCIWKILSSVRETVSWHSRPVTIILTQTENNQCQRHRHRRSWRAKYSRQQHRSRGAKSVSDSTIIHDFRQLPGGSASYLPYGRAHDKWDQLKCTFTRMFHDFITPHVKPARQAFLVYIGNVGEKPVNFCKVMIVVSAFNALLSVTHAHNDEPCTMWSRG